MSAKSLAALMARVAATPEGQAEHATVAFLAQVNARMQAQGMSNAELARRMGTSAAYVTRLFRGNANLSVQTMVKLAQAVGATLELGLTRATCTPTPETVAAMLEAREMMTAHAGTDTPPPVLKAVRKKVRK